MGTARPFLDFGHDFFCDLRPTLLVDHVYNFTDFEGGDN